MVISQTNYNGLVESNFKYIEPLQDHVENEWKDDVDERGDEAIQQVEICPAGHVSRFYWPKQAREIHTPQGE